MRKTAKQFFTFFLIAVLLFATGCSNSNKKAVNPLQDINQIPEDGIITKEQFSTVAGEEKEIKFTESLDSGITYTWTIHAKLIKNPQDQNLKIAFETDVLDDIKSKIGDSVNGIGMKMAGKGLVAASKLSITVPEIWEAEEASLVKEENGTFVSIVPVAITKNDAEGTTTLSMNLTNMEEECYIIGTGMTSGDGADSGSENTEESDEVTTEDEKVTTEEKAETTTEKKQETTTSKKEETTTAKKEETTTSKKEETTTAKKEETTTAKQEETTEAPKKLTCTISINCATILDNMDKLDPAKKDFVPGDGWILKKITVTFEKGETVHDVLKRVCRDKGIHMESTYTPVYDSAYVEGINQIYEFDCGSESGWMYKVNGWFPNYGSSQYEVSDGDEIAWVYTCNLGDDVGDNSMQ